MLIAYWCISFIRENYCTIFFIFIVIGKSRLLLLGMAQNLAHKKLLILNNADSVFHILSIRKFCYIICMQFFWEIYLSLWLGICTKIKYRKFSITNNINFCVRSSLKDFYAINLKIMQSLMYQILTIRNFTVVVCMQLTRGHFSFP